MSSHIHLIVAQHNANLAAVIRDFKSYTAKRILHLIETSPIESCKEWLMHMFKFYARFHNQNCYYQFWQKTSRPIELVTAAVLEQKREYIQQNPVKAMLVISPEAYVYSCANPDSWFKVDKS
jgi:putative transposase